jgi:alpha/beta superfamily hydrolase
MAGKIRFMSDRYEIEGCLEKSSLQRGVVITHPHPLYGGDMHNNVVAAIARVYRQKGYTALRFNFRGVGNSQGSYGDGVGEQEDVRAAVSYLADLGIGQIDLAGYSFGAWVNALAVRDESPLANMIMVSPPVAFIDFGSISGLGSLRLIVTGSRDDIAPPDRIKKSYAAWNAAARFEVISGADHFYAGYLDKLEAILAAYLEDKEEQS